MQETTTRVPAVLDALNARLRAVLEADRWECFDGPPMNQTVEMDVFILGWPDFDGTTVTVASQRSEGYGHRYEEGYDIRCILSSESGDEDNKARRDRIESGLALVEAELKQGPDDVIDKLEFGPEQQWAQFQSENGAAAEVSFTIRAWVSR